ARKGNRRYTRLEQLSGRTIPLPAGSAAEGAIELVNQRLAQRRMAPIRIEKLDASLAVEDVMEMVQAGILGFTVVEQPIAERWAKVLPKLRVDRHLVLDNRADMAWYVRRDASTLRATIDRFLADYRAPADQDVAFQRVYRRAYKVRNPL
ncbi:lytic transglycosylase F, partial [Pseudomonas aeruginosa]|nr:lytic transglycosylase F [Pseudomonas aeruginosa]